MEQIRIGVVAVLAVVLIVAACPRWADAETIPATYNPTGEMPAGGDYQWFTSCSAACAH